MPGPGQGRQQRQGGRFGSHAEIGGEGSLAATGEAGSPGKPLARDGRRGGLEFGRRERGTQSPVT